jgi:hypothetical protein
MVRILGGLGDRGIVIALLAQNLFHLGNCLLVKRLVLEDSLLVEHVQWPEDHLAAVMALLPLLHHFA